MKKKELHELELVNFANQTYCLDFNSIYNKITQKHPGSVQKKKKTVPL